MSDDLLAQLKEQRAYLLAAAQRQLYVPMRDRMLLEAIEAQIAVIEAEKSEPR